MKKLLRISAIILLLASTAACGTDDPEKEHFRTSFDNMFGYLASADGSGVATKVGTMSLEFNFDKEVATVTIDDVMAQGMTMNFRAEEVAFTTDADGVRHIRGGSAGNRGVSGIQIDYWPPVLHDGVGRKLHGVFVKLTLTSGNTLTLFPYSCIAVGTTATTPAGGEAYVTTRTVYDITLNPADGTAQIDVERAAFSADMPTLGTMHFEGSGDTAIRLSLSADGYSLGCEALAPEIAGVPYERFMIRNLACEARLSANRASLTFGCMNYAVDATVSPLSVEYKE